ncbi:MAG: thiamine-phosphate kinase [Gammaproteobacteria bacterium]|jgi:thiamine-monophosphate kinase|nr:thiamine-phosphate kinase [Gammaproteobacteria bacterium]MBT7308086.1 thiamine-phosphate kinase [Gammaproteobacteria bacterium]
MTNRKSSIKVDTEFSLIERYFAGRDSYHSDTLLSVGDDAALLQIPQNHQLVLSVDTLVEGTHFLKGADPEALAHKLLAVNLSDLAAMGAEPRWATLALTLPEVDSQWLDHFSRGLFLLAERYQIDLVGGDTTRGPLTLTLQIHGIIPLSAEVRRRGAKPGEQICVTNSLGAAGFALQQLLEGEGGASVAVLQQPLDRPTPQIEAGLLLRNHATAMIDISDGLLADLGHILEQSGVGAWLELDAIPIHPYLLDLPRVQQLTLALTAGEDYQLCFTLSPERLEEVANGLAEIGCEMSVVGEIRSQSGLHWEGEWRPEKEGFQHF